MTYAPPVNPAPPRTARQILEARLGRKLPVLADDERQAVKLLALQLIRNRRATA